jgi:hypothetical protein
MKVGLARASEDRTRLGCGRFDSLFLGHCFEVHIVLPFEDVDVRGKEVRSVCPLFYPLHPDKCVEFFGIGFWSRLH